MKSSEIVNKPMASLSTCNPGFFILWMAILFSLVKNVVADQQNDTLSGYRSRPGDCKGGDIGGVDGVTTAEACALKCDDVVECVGFVFVTSPKPGCFLKLVSCVETSPHDGTTMYDSVGECTCFYHMDIFYVVTFL